MPSDRILVKLLLKINHIQKSQQEFSKGSYIVGKKMFKRVHSNFL